MLKIILTHAEFELTTSTTPSIAQSVTSTNYATETTLFAYLDEHISIAKVYPSTYTEGVYCFFTPQAFSGLNGSLTNRETYIHMSCGNGKTRLFREIFTPNLHWVRDLRIYRCYLENGLPSRLLENFKSLQLLYIWKGGIEGNIAPDALIGLTNLQYITLQTQIRNGSFSSVLFDGLTTLISIDLKDAQLSVIPPNSLNGLVNLKQLHLSDNNLATLPPGLFDGLRSLTNVNLANNPWNCSCPLMWLIDWLHITGLFTIYINTFSRF